MKEYIVGEDSYAYEMRRYDELKELIRCKDCMYKPTQHEEDDETIIDFPVPFKCPCECEDPWYDWVPEDDWFCGNAKRREEE